MPTLAEYEDWKAGLQKSSIGAANVVLSDAQTVNPDQFAGDIKLGKAFGLPAGIVAEGRDGFAARLQSKRNETILKSSPLMASWLGLDDNAKVAHDDLENLSWFEAFGRGAVATAQRAHQRVDQMGNQYMFEQTARRASDRGMTFGQILDDERDTLQGPNPGETHKAWAGIGDVLAASARYLDARYADLIGADDKEAAARFAAGVAAAQERMAATPKSAIAQSFEDAAMVKGAWERRNEADRGRTGNVGSRYQESGLRLGDKPKQCFALRMGGKGVLLGSAGPGPVSRSVPHHRSRPRSTGGVQWVG